MSFNVDGFENDNDKTNHNTNNAVWLKQVSWIINNSQADIVLLQEFNTGKKNSKTEIEKFRNKLGVQWQYFCTNEYIVNPEKLYSQNNIIFYKNTRVLPTSKKDRFINFYGEEKKYKFVKNHTQVIQFCLSSNQSKEFLVCNVHLPVPDKKNKWKLKCYYDDMSELSQMYKDLSNDNKIVIAGDFNTSRFDILNRNQFPNAIVDGEKNNYIMRNFSLLTHLWRKEDSLVLSSDFDHFIVRNVKLSNDMRHAFYANDNYPKNSYHNLLINGTYYNSNKQYYKDISDHLPVMIDVEIE